MKSKYKNEKILICSICWEDGCHCTDSIYVEIDIELVDIICTLNRKGYITRNCCQGHIDSPFVPQTYIQFNEVYDFEEIPNDFIYEIQELSNSRTVSIISRELKLDTDVKIRNNYKDSEKLMREKVIEERRKSSIEELRTWVKRLTPINEREIGRSTVMNKIIRGSLYSLSEVLTTDEYCLKFLMIDQC